MNELKVLLIGATGVFGSRLAEQLAVENGIALTLAARNQNRLKAMATRLTGPLEIKVLDRDVISAADLAGYDLVIDAAGPFQSSGSQVIDAAIQAGCHYFDLADGREFIANTSNYDTSARRANIAVITGASSIPALSHAVIDHLIAGWKQVERIKIGIFPGNRAPRGKAVVEAILSYTGKPVRIFRNGKWQQLSGWGMTHREHIPLVGKRWASICDTPEQDLLVKRYKPEQSAEFFAGMELSILHLGLLFLSIPVRWGILRSLRPAAGILLWIAQRLIAFGSDRGGMMVEVWGRNANDQKVGCIWSLQANANHGPYVPTLAVLILARHLRDGKLTFIGASACSGFLSLDDFQQDFDRFGLTSQIDHLAHH